jgi:hypothetical protein
MLNERLRIYVRDRLKHATYLEDPENGTTLEGIIQNYVINRFEYHDKRELDFDTASDCEFDIHRLRRDPQNDVYCRNQLFISR